jgi:DNA-binding transcriptional ArsR family regulator
VNDVFHALRDPTRREIVRLLRSGDKSAGELAQAFPLAKSTLSGHFNVLKRAGLIVAERDGTTIVYSLNVSALEEIVAMVMELLDVGGGRPDADRKAAEVGTAEASEMVGETGATGAAVARNA